MKNIGTTSTGNVIVEMTAQEYEALVRLQSASTTETSTKPIEKTAAPPMSHAERVSYVAERLKKLGPKKRDGVRRSIEPMFQFNGGIEAKDVERIIATLEKQRFFSITSDDRVTYAKT